MAGRHAKKKKMFESEQRPDDLELVVNEGDEKGVQTIHEMITEALMGAVNGAGNNITGTTGPNNFQTDPTTGNLVYMNTADQEPVTLEKLFNQFRNLDGRLSRVEDIVLKRELYPNTGEKRVTTLARPKYPGFVNDQISSPSRLSEFSTINPLLTSSTDILSVAYSDFSDPSAFSTSHLQTPSHLKRGNDIRRSDLDHYCLPLLERDPKPSVEQLQGIVDSIIHIYPHFTHKQLLSKVREWFRKRREYMSQRIFQACAECFKDVRIESEAELNAHISTLSGNDQVVEAILRTADLEINDPTVAKDYCRDKIASYFDGLYRHSTVRNRPH